ncbi:hypothetical protein KQ303_10715 [Synechococcus sp. CS-1333]|uniref:hypothetical protein n=1 Tax=Synechococcus sp. CS-1333 TaxID=2848638 RepID=UPI00223B984E|nr:hypothetical protein [Synechococcus sp. CS-1333]MCT0211139.1 hypothetical protein [Synechococcus sp. CS-1333]
MPPRRVDHTGKHFGRLVVIEFDRSSNKWLCRCECGTKKLIRADALVSGDTKSCGCLFESKKNNLEGQRFGMLAVVERAPGSSWICKCDCGTLTRPVYVTDLTQGKQQSCGCDARAKASRRARKHIDGKRFGRLVATRFSHIDNNGKSVWFFDCDCGTKNFTATVSRVMHINGPTRSCGCLKSVPGSATIVETGNVHNKLTVLREWGKDKHGKVKWLSQCECGKTAICTGAQLRSGAVKSCGCHRREVGRILGTSIGKYNRRQEGHKHYADDPQYAQRPSCLYLVEVRGVCEKIGIAFDIPNRGRKDYTEVWYSRKLPRACCWAVEQVALALTKEFELPRFIPELEGIDKGFTEMRFELPIDETIDLLNELSEECLLLGWEEFYEKYSVAIPSALSSLP